MRRIILILIIFLSIILYHSTSYAIWISGFGLHCGGSYYYGKLLNEEAMKILPDAKDIGFGNTYGAHIQLAMNQKIIFELASEYYAKTTFSPVANTNYDLIINFRDISFSLTPKFRLYTKKTPIPLYKMELARIYGGIGLGMHIINTELRKNPIELGGDSLDPEIMKNDKRLSANALLELRMTLPVLKVALFTGGKYNMIFLEDEKLHTFLFYAGFTMSFRFLGIDMD